MKKLFLGLLLTGGAISISAASSSVIDKYYQNSYNQALGQVNPYKSQYCQENDPFSIQLCAGYNSALQTANQYATDGKSYAGAASYLYGYMMGLNDLTETVNSNLVDLCPRCPVAPTSALSSNKLGASAPQSKLILPPKPTLPPLPQMPNFTK